MVGANVHARARRNISRKLRMRGERRLRDVSPRGRRFSRGSACIFSPELPTVSDGHYLYSKGNVPLTQRRRNIVVLKAAPRNMERTQLLTKQVFLATRFKFKHLKRVAARKMLRLKLCAIHVTRRSF